VTDPSCGKSLLRSPRLPFHAALPLLLVLGGCPAYGVDSRMDVEHVVMPGAPHNADSTAAMFWARALTGPDAAGNFGLPRDTLVKVWNVCPDDRFAQQPSGAWCTAFLVGDDVVASAGHCIQDTSPGDVRIVFDYRTHNDVPVVTLPETSVYTPTQVIQRDAAGDWELVRLNRRVPANRPRLTLAGSDVASGDHVYIIGYPLGLPEKYADNGVVRSVNPTSTFFVAAVTSFVGNSGSPVFNVGNQVVGLLREGDREDLVNTSQGCMRVLTCQMTACEGEQATKVSQFRNAVSAAIGHVPPDGAVAGGSQ